MQLKRAFCMNRMDNIINSSTIKLRRIFEFINKGLTFQNITNYFFHDENYLFHDISEYIERCILN